MAEQPLDYATPSPPRKSRIWIFAILSALAILLLMMLLFSVRMRAVPTRGTAPAPAPTSPGGGS